MTKKIAKIVIPLCALLLGASQAFAQTSSTTPGLPTTGVAGNAFASTMTILVALFLIIAGSVYVGTRNKKL